MKCPECKEQINCLLSEEKALVYFYFTVSKTGEPRYEGGAKENAPFDDGEEPVYLCPECLNVLAENQTEAIKLMNGGKK